MAKKKVISSRTSIYPTDEVYSLLEPLTGNSLGLRRRIQVLLHNGYLYERNSLRIAPGILAALEGLSPDQIAGLQAQMKVTSEATSASIAPSVGVEAGPHQGQIGLAPDSQSSQTAGKKPRTAIQVDHLEDL